MQSPCAINGTIELNNNTMLIQNFTLTAMLSANISNRVICCLNQIVSDRRVIIAEGTVSFGFEFFPGFETEIHDSPNRLQYF
jgi:hypothetical protein